MAVTSFDFDSNDDEEDEWKPWPFIASEEEEGEDEAEDVEEDAVNGPSKSLVISRNR
jgi:hypothetical protein